MLPISITAADRLRASLNRPAASPAVASRGATAAPLPGAAAVGQIPSPVAAQSVAKPVSQLTRVGVDPAAAVAPEMNPFERSRKQLNAANTPIAGDADVAQAGQAEPVRSDAYLQMRESLRAATLDGTGDRAPTVDATPVESPVTSTASPESAPVAVAPPVALSAKASALARLRASIAAAPATGLPPMEFGEFDSTDSGGESSSSSARAELALDSVAGRLVTIKEFNGWAIGTMYTEDRQEIRVKGEVLIGLKEGLEYTIQGRHTSHSQHGEGFDAVSVAPLISANDAAIEHYMVRFFNGIGPVKASKYLKLVRNEGGDEAVEKLRATLLNEPWLLDLSQIDEKAKFSDAPDQHHEMKLEVVRRNLMLRLGSVPGFKESVAKDLAVHLLLGHAKDNPVVKGQPVLPIDIVGETWARLMRNPYEPIRKTPGYGFKTAEALAGVAGIPRDSDMRYSALVEYAVEQGCQSKGHSYLNKVQFIQALQRIDPAVQPQKALVAAAKDGCVIIDGARVYSPNLFEAEKSLAKHVALLMQETAPLTARRAEEVVRKLNRDAAKINPAFKDGFDHDQSNALASIMTDKHRIHVLTGGPGTGKTAIMEAMLHLLPNKKFAFAAPTGKAAKVMTNRVKRFGYTAVTLNSLLQGAEESGFKVNKEEPLDIDILVLDENTMTGIVMGNAALEALPAHTHLIVLGDPGLPADPDVPDSARAGQLPSISPGRFMQDLLLIPGINHLHLTKTYRNDGGILEVVQQTSRGKLETHDRLTVKFSHTLPEAEEGFPAVMQQYLENVQRDGIENTLLLMPMRKGDKDTPGWNATYANHVLRSICNPHGEKIPGSTMFLGDRIIIRENQRIKQPSPSTFGMISRAPVYEVQSMPEPTSKGFDFDKLRIEMEEKSSLGEDDKAEIQVSEKEEGEEERTEQVVNGDTGMITAFVMAGNNKRLGGPQWLELKLDDGRTLHFPGSEMGGLQHSYALTIHSAQGSECKNVALVVTPGNADFMNQNMLFTGESRARQQLSIHGDDAVIKKIAATPMPMRNSALVERAVQEMAKAETPEEAEAVADEEIPF